MRESVNFINDGGYVVKPQTGLIRTYCPYYSKWQGIKRRVCAEEYRQKNPSYREASCSEEWLYFSNFKGWMENQPWEGMELDKDIIVPSNKLYSEDTCCFVPKQLNIVFRDYSMKRIKANLPMGVTLYPSATTRKSKVKYKVQVSTIDKVQKYLGLYETKEEAHSVWQEAKAKEFEACVYWWQFSPEVNHSFNIKAAQSILDRAEKLVQDRLHGRETLTI